MNNKQKLYKEIKEKKLYVGDYYDNPTSKNQISSKSVHVTLMFDLIDKEISQQDEDIVLSIGFSFKSIGDNFSKYKSRKIAYKRYLTNKYNIKIPFKVIAEMYISINKIYSTYTSFFEFCRNNIVDIDKIIEKIDSKNFDTSTYNGIIYQNGNIIIRFSDLVNCYIALQNNLPDMYYIDVIESIVIKYILENILTNKNNNIFTGSATKNKMLNRIINILTKKFRQNHSRLKVIDTYQLQYGKFFELINVIKNTQEENKDAK